MPAYFFYEAGRKIFSGDSEGIGNNRGKCDFDPKVWLGTSPQEVIRLYVAGRDKTFRCLNKWYMRFVVINQNEKDYN